MRLGPSFTLAFRRLVRRPIRTVLLLQGTIWGVAVAIFPSAVIQGTRDAALTQGMRLGADRVSIAADPTSAQRRALTRADLEAVGQRVQEAGIRVEALGGVRVVRTLEAPDVATAPEAAGPTLLAATPGAERARGLALARGRWLAPDDGPTRCVLEAGVPAWLGRPALEPGDTVTLPGIAGPLEVVGIAAARTAQARRTSDLGFDLEHAMYKKMARAFLLAMGLPIVRDGWKRSDRCVFVPLGDDPPTGELDWLFLRVDPREVSRAAQVARDSLARDGKAAVTLHPLVLPVMMGQEIDRFAAVNLAMFLACLVMGAVVMMNLGLLNVLTRGREIAVRRTEGATRADIARQFLGEGLFLSLLGAALGCGLGVLLAWLRASLEPVTGFTWAFPWREAAAAVAVALLVGLLASWLPATKAGRQDPVVGLADE